MKSVLLIAILGLGAYVVLSKPKAPAPAYNPNAVPPGTGTAANWVTALSGAVSSIADIVDDNSTQSS